MSVRDKNSKISLLPPFPGLLISLLISAVAKGVSSGCTLISREMEIVSKTEISLLF